MYLMQLNGPCNSRKKEKSVKSRRRKAKGKWSDKTSVQQGNKGKETNETNAKSICCFYPRINIKVAGEE
jgi:hypothetical protein